MTTETERYKAFLDYCDAHAERLPRRSYVELADLYEKAPVYSNLDRTLYVVIKNNLGNFSMRHFHNSPKHGSTNDFSCRFGVENKERIRAHHAEPTECGTTHCIAGWACITTSALPLELEHGSELVAAATYYKNTGSCPDFYEMSKDEALDNLRERAGL